MIAAATGKFSGMAKKPKRGRPPGRTPAYIAYARIRVEVGDALEKYRDSLEPFPPTLSRVVEVALEKYLTEMGFPPADKP